MQSAKPKGSHKFDTVTSTNYLQKWLPKPLNPQQIRNQEKRNADIAAAENDIAALTLGEAAEILNIDVAKLLKLSHDGVAPYFGRRYNNHTLSYELVYARNAIQKFKIKGKPQ